jgi:hypothetical protein
VKQAVSPKPYRSWGPRPASTPRPFEQTRRFGRASSKTGMTTLFSRQPRTYWLAFEDSVRSVKIHPTSAYAVIDSYDVLLATINTLADLKRTGKCPYDHVIFDTVDRMQYLTRLHLNTDFLAQKDRSGQMVDITEWAGGKGGWSILANHTIAPIMLVDTAGFGWTCLAHIKLRPKDPDNPKSEDKETAAVTPAVQTALEAACDLYFQLESDWKRMGSKKVKTATGTSTQPIWDRQVFWRTVEKTDDIPYDNSGCRVSMSDSFFVPRDNGYEAVKAEYDAAVARDRDFWDNAYAEETTNADQ